MRRGFELVDSGIVVQLIILFASIITALIGVIVYAARLMLSGRLMSRVLVNEIIEEWKLALAREKITSSEWKLNFEKEHEAHRLTIQQVTELMEVAETASGVLRALPVRRPTSNEVA